MTSDTRKIAYLTQQALLESQQCVMTLTKAVCAPMSQVELRRLYFARAFSHGAALSRLLGWEAASNLLMAWLEASGGFPTFSTRYWNDTERTFFSMVTRELCIAHLGSDQLDVLLKTVCLPQEARVELLETRQGPPDGIRRLIAQALHQDSGPVPAGTPDFNPDDVVC